MRRGDDVADAGRSGSSGAPVGCEDVSSHLRRLPAPLSLTGTEESSVALGTVRRFDNGGWLVTVDSAGAHAPRGFPTAGRVDCRASQPATTLALCGFAGEDGKATSCALRRIGEWTDAGAADLALRLETNRVARAYGARVG